MQIYLARNNQQAGPYTLDQVNQMLAGQQILLTDLIWHEGMTEWKALGEITQGQMIYQPQGYSAPQTQTATASFRIDVKKQNLAPIAKRALAKLFDMALWIPVFAIPSFMMDLASKEKILAMQNETFNAQSQQQIFDLITPQAWQAMAVYVLIMLAIQAFFIAKNGQSLGKKLLHIQIVDAQTSTKVNLTRAFLLRSVVFVILNFISMPLITILDYVLAFGKKQQTLHDLIAKTKVINCEDKPST